MMSMMTRSQNTTRVRIALLTVAALTLVLAAAPPAQAAGAPVCGPGVAGLAGGASSLSGTGRFPR